jgi:hypothetical protein
MGALIQSIALDVAGLGLLGAGAYSLITGKGGTAAATSLMTLGGGYLGYKVSVATSSSTTVSPSGGSTQPGTLPPS